ncbi:helix-turn-helix domain-containing protein [Dongia deserti]|uniref:helix-turn-helix domain-containing protein n=1 Tax=Dongia deserti TaxID=2268030 RepID=UPI000E656519|nr:XRE family transcriptional regulator [Dongia deserti]
MSSIVDEALDSRIAARIRAERSSRGWSLEELAERSAVSRAMISKVERCESSPTAALLGRLSSAFGLTLSQLLARAEQGTARLLNREAEQERWRDRETGFERRALTPPGSASPLELVWGELPPKAKVDYPSAAFNFIEDQQIVVIAGRLSFTQGAQDYQLRAGDCLRLGPPADCRFENSGSTACRYIVAVLRRSR